MEGKGIEFKPQTRISGSLDPIVCCMCTHPEVLKIEEFKKNQSLNVIKRIY